MIDTHTHSNFSHDAQHSIQAIVAEAKKRGITYLAITDHCDWDYLSFGGYNNLPMLDLDGYLQEMQRVRADIKGIELAIGLELGYHARASARYKDKIPFEKMDYIINSVHSIGNYDVYFPEFFRNKKREEAFRSYLLGVLESIDAPYPYNTIGHIGYISKNAIYNKKNLAYKDFPDILDEILKKIIDKNKTIELNFNIKTDLCMPNQSILKRYLELGGENITFASDAHSISRLADGYSSIKELALSLGFKYWTVYKKMKPYKIPIINES